VACLCSWSLARGEEATSAATASLAADLLPDVHVVTYGLVVEDGHRRWWRTVTTGLRGRERAVLDIEACCATCLLRGDVTRVLGALRARSFAPVVLRLPFAADSWLST
jgi:hypothetical protein